MSEVLHANIFFLITGIAVIVCTCLLAIVLFHLIKTMKALRRIVESIEAGAEVIAEDFEQIRALFAEGGLVSMFMSFLTGRSRRGGSRRGGVKTDRKKGDLVVSEEDN